MDYNTLLVAKLYRETVELYYTPTEFAQVTYPDHRGDLHTYIKCIFCGEQASLNSYAPKLEVFNRWIESGNLEALASNTFTLYPACKLCANKLQRCTAYTLEDQHAFIKSLSNGTYKFHG